jgi:hypothetical protein
MVDRECNALGEDEICIILIGQLRERSLQRLDVGGVII